MRRVEIDFASDALPMFGGGQRRVLWWGLLAMALLLLLVCLGVIWQAGTTSAELSAQIAELDESTRSIEATRQQAAGVSADELESVNAAVRYLNYPWVDLLGALERHVRPEVTLVSLEMGITRPSIKLTVQAPDVGQALGYVDSIKAEPALRGLAVTKHEEATTENGKASRVLLEIPQAVPSPRQVSRGEGR